MSELSDVFDGCRCSQAVRRFEFVLMDDGVTINRYECSNGRYVLLEDVRKQEVAELNALQACFRDAGEKAENAATLMNREYHRGVQDGLMSWRSVKFFGKSRS